MKRQIVVTSILLTAVLCAACGDNTGVQSENSVQEQEIGEEKEEKDLLDGYEEDIGAERFGAEVSFEITGELDKTIPDDVYSNTNSDGTLKLFLYTTDGTPYLIEGPVYDHEIFSMQTYVKRDGGASDAAGSGITMDMYLFTPTHAGETEILTLNTYVGDEVDIFEGTIYHVTVEEDLTCRMDWYAGVTEGENMELLQD